MSGRNDLIVCKEDTLFMASSSFSLSLSYPEVRYSINIECPLNHFISQLVQFLSRYNPGIIDEDGHVTCVLFNLVKEHVTSECDQNFGATLAAVS